MGGGRGIGRESDKLTEKDLLKKLHGEGTFFFSSTDMSTFWLNQSMTQFSENPQLKFKKIEKKKPRKSQI